MKNTILLSLLALAIITMAGTGCSISGPKSLYPPPESLSQAPVQRQEFVDLFLQGHWCTSQTAFEMSVENYLRSDNFCAAAYNYRLAARLKQYIGQTDENALKAARELADAGSDCRLNTDAPAGSDETTLPLKDAYYSKLLRNKAWADLQATLSQERDSLYASVYARKAVAATLAVGQDDFVGTFLETAMKTDGAQGWVVFLVEDWKLALEMEKNATRQDAIRRRLETLQTLIEPCLDE